jgi:hypothetical protein
MATLTVYYILYVASSSTQQRTARKNCVRQIRKKSILIQASAISGPQREATCHNGTKQENSVLSALYCLIKPQYSFESNT